MAAIDPTAEFDASDARATLKLIRITDDDEDSDDEDYDPDNIEELRAKLLADGVLGSDDDSEEESDEEANGGPSDPAKSKQALREALQKKLQEEAAADEMEIELTNGTKGKGKALDGEDSEEDSEDEDEEGDEAEELVLCTLDPEKVCAVVRS